MGYQNEKSSILQGFDKGKRERLDVKLEHVSLRDIPLEARRKEARKPLFLTRYE